MHPTLPPSPSTTVAAPAGRRTPRHIPRLVPLTVAALLAAGALAGCSDDGDGGASGGDTTSASATDGTASTTPAPAADASTTSVVPRIDVGDGGDYTPEIDPADFVDTIDNPYWPLTAGSRWVYEGVSDGEQETIEVTVLDETREVMGITATVVRDTVTDADGQVVEDTWDWYAQDVDGNVWYLGEDTQEYEGGEVSSTEGSWEAGVGGALPGIVMQAEPTTGAAYRQEYLAGEAEDVAEIMQVGASVSVPTGDYTDVVVIREWNPFSPEVLEDKYYAPGVGLVLEVTVEGGEGRTELTTLELA